MTALTTIIRTNKIKASTCLILVVGAAFFFLLLRDNKLSLESIFAIDHVVSADLSKQEINDVGKQIFFVNDMAGSAVTQANLNISLEDKSAKENELNKLASWNDRAVSQKELYDALIRNNANLDPDMALRMKNNAMTASDWEKIDIYAALLLTEDDNFKMELWQYKDFDELKSAFEKRQQRTGVFNGTGFLNEPGAYKNAKFESIKKIIDSGAVLPEDFIKKAINANNLDLAIELKAAGYNVNSHFVDKYKSMNALEIQIENYALNPYGSTPEEQANNLQKLIDLGVPLKVNDGTRDALDLVLQGVYGQDENEAAKLMILAKKLHELGLPVEVSHHQLLDKIKDKYPSLYAEVIDVFE